VDLDLEELVVIMMVVREEHLYSLQYHQLVGVGEEELRHHLVMDNLAVLEVVPDI
jgi:hypothetical protein